ncbi:MAG: fimbria/pilus periplasmic chaperone, partial [Proteobacteria bacterium]|nr:fimbria/pilus periplasmic chaperone [Pseudomonadota bacterium]
MQYTHPPARNCFPLSRAVPAGVFLVVSMFFPAHAANFSVSPIIRDIPAETGIAVFEITNQDDQPLSFQVQAFSWTQRNGEDVREPAEDLLVVPPVATVAADRTQIVRVALRNPDRSREHAYRVVIRELPKQDEDSRGLALQTLLAFDVPLFFAAEDATRELAWRVSNRGAGKLLVSADNIGTRFARFDSIRVMGPGDQRIAVIKGPLYILAGARQSWEVTPNPGSNLSDGAPVKLVYSSF